MNESQLLAAARQHDEDAFARLIEPYRRERHAHCYRMLGSATDAEDALQDALLGAWRGLRRFEGRSSLRSWLYTIATNACLRAIERRPKRVLPIDYGPPSDPHDPVAEPLLESVWIEPYPDTVPLESATPDARYEQREAVELAFIAALQHLPARQRAVLILRDVLGFSARETAEALDTTSVSVDSALQRAHKAVDARLAERSQQATLRSLDDEELKQLVEKFVVAWERADIDAVVSMLAEDAALTMPPTPMWFAGRDAIRALFAAHPLAPGAPPIRLIPTQANGPDRVRPLRLGRRGKRVHASLTHRRRAARVRDRRSHDLQDRRGAHGVRAARTNRTGLSARIADGVDQSLRARQALCDIPNAPSPTATTNA